MKRSYKVGQEVVYVATKRSAHPGPRAHDIRPETSGECYLYQVDKFWIVEEVREHSLVLLTRRGKRHEVELEDSSIRPATIWERFIHRDRFPTLADSHSGMMPPYHLDESARGAALPPH